MKLKIREDFQEPSITYDQFKDDYTWALKKYPDTYRFYDKYDVVCGTMETTNYEKQGNRWIQIESDIKDITGRMYMNIIDATPFFKNLGGKESVSKCATRYGYIPCQIISTNPNGTERTTRKMTFDKSISF